MILNVVFFGNPKKRKLTISHNRWELKLSSGLPEEEVQRYIKFSESICRSIWAVNMMTYRGVFYKNITNDKLVIVMGNGKHGNFNMIKFEE